MIEIKIYYVNGNGHDCVKMVQIDCYPDYLTIDGQSCWPPTRDTKEKHGDGEMEAEKLLRCPECGEIVNNSYLDQEAMYGNIGYCYCKYGPEPDGQGDIWFPKEFIEYKEIGLDLCGPLEEVK